MTDTSTTDRASPVPGGRARRIACVLLVVTALLFGTGAASEDEGHAERGAEASEVSDVHVDDAPSESEEADELEHPAGEAEHDDSHVATGDDDEGRVLGVDIESPLAVGSAIVVSLVLAAGLWATGWRQVPWAVVACGLGFAILDAIEVSRQLYESRRVLAALAAAITLGHLGAAAAAGYAATRASTGSAPR